MAKYQQFKLYVAGISPKSERMILKVIAFFDDAFGDDYQLDVIDVVHDPEQAEIDHIMATPTLVRVAPLPRCLVIGDLFHTDKVKQALDLADDPIQRRSQ